MNVSRLCEYLQTGVGPLFMCSEQGEYLRVRTPYLYPDGDYIDIFCKVDGGVMMVSDLAETTAWLRMQSATLRRSSRQRLLIEDVCVTHGIEFHRGMLQARCRSGDELAQVVTRVAQAALRVSDLWFTFRTRTVQSTRKRTTQSTADEVADFLTERKFQFERAIRLAGRSGRDWDVDFSVRTEKRDSLVQVLRAENRTVAQEISARALAAWHDLSHYAVEREAMTFVSLFDDRCDVWAAEDVRLVRPSSKVTFWSRPDEFAEVLREAA